ncbi:hypothetical protein SAMN05216503_1997 [Polaribacter sp. KT25b]|uniref:hypothetical protein n=1 Tax=Polaribacter sp. KT25b TaxID=1855336 RepID=UPI00087BBD9D|nr:hypothetical protein [Polaribacter sp. KT25b]SDS10586.1 hypothetical protein SAMN05216503_1997 [Polaribacter sp. KT25b]
MNFNFLKSKPKHIYSELKPMERITKLFLEFTFPYFEKNEFKYLKSQQEFKKRNDFFLYSVHWYGRKYNEGNLSVEFDIVLNVTSTKYRKWEKEFYNLGEKRERGIDGTRVDYIENWNKEYYYSGWYDLVKDDNEKVMKRICENFETSGKDFFDNFKSLDSAINKLKKYPIANFESIIDFYIIQNKWSEANMFFEENRSWYEKKEKIEGNDPNSEYCLNRKEHFELRREKIKNWLQQHI